MGWGIMPEDRHLDDGPLPKGSAWFSMGGSVSLDTPFWFSFRAVMLGDSDWLRLKVGNVGHYEIPHRAIKTIKFRRSSPWRGIRIIHSEKIALPEKIIFWPKDLPRLLLSLKQYGYPVEEALSFRDLTRWY